MDIEETNRPDHGAGHTRVRIHVDRQPHESPNPTTGVALYGLGRVAEGHVLYREVRGDREDDLVERGDEVVQLEQDEHFYSAEDHRRGYTVIVNGRQKTVHANKLTFAQVVALAFDNPPTGENVVFTVTYRRGPHRNPEGTLVAGASVRIKNGMIFNVTATDKS